MSLLSLLADLLTLILEGRMPPNHSSIIFQCQPDSLKKRRVVGFAPIAVGSTIRRLASKCTFLEALECIPHLLSPYQLGFSVPGGAKAAVHATRIYLNYLPPQKALLKIDFRSAFNSSRRDMILEVVEAHIPELLPFVHSVYSAPSRLLREDDQILQSE